MDRILVAAAALNQTPFAWEENCAHIRAALKEAQAMGAQIVCLPELCVSGYGCEDAFHSSGVVAEALALAVELAKETKGLIANFGVPLIVQGTVYNTVAVAVDGVLRGFVAKQHLPGDGIHYEPRWFKPWQRGVVSTVEVDGAHIPVGDIFFEIDGIRIGFEICEDAWVAERPGIFLAQHGVDLILNPSASHFAFSKHEVRKRFVAEGSRAFGVSYIYANLLGCESGRVVYDGETLIGSHGGIIAEGERLSFADVKLLTGVVDIDRSRLLRMRQSSFRPQYEPGDRLVRVEGFSIKRTTKKTNHREQAWESSSDIKHEEFTRAVALGLFDYLRKSKSEGFVVSLSGGVDSSAASCLVALMVEAAVKELGLQTVKNKLSYISSISKVRSEEELVRELLACAYQATKNSSQATHKAARGLARELGATFYDLNVEKIVGEYTSMVSSAMGRKLSWNEHDTALQNIQARVRSPSIWLVANLRRALLLTTSNRSEAAVGYTTMDGDSSGGLSPLGGIDKAYLRTWLAWLEKTGPLGLRKYPSLRLVNEQAPTAELRPRGARQTDEGDLMPYRVLDVIERYAVRDKLLPRAVFDALCEDFAEEFSFEQLRHWVSRFFALWSTNQWKRERYAPSFHLDDESVDPKTWCRFPILSGGFKKELAELAKLPLGKSVVKAARKAAPKKKVKKGKR